MKPDNMIQNKNYCNCADLDAPEMFIIMDFNWAKENSEKIRATKGVEGFNISHGWFYIADPKDRLLFTMRWT